MHPFEELAARIEETWVRRDYDERAFPDIATRALEEAKLAGAVGYMDVARWVLGARALPTQDDLGANFGQPPVTVCRGRRFFIQVLLWREGSTAIHRHGFSGAFTLLAGESLHTRYGFDVERRVSARFLLGEVRLLGASLLGKGDVVPITHDLAHALFHLDAPSATVVVRTFREEDTFPQYNYHPPRVALDPFHDDPVTRRQLQTLGFVRKTEPEAYAKLAAALVGRSDLHSAYLVLLQAHRGPRGPEDAPAVLEAARAQHGEVVDELANVIHEALRDEQVGRARAQTKNVDVRFFLSLLQNLQEPRVIAALLEARYPDKPGRETIRALLRAHESPASLGADLADEPTRIVVDALLDGCAEDEIVSRFVEIFGAEEAARERGAILRHAARLRRTALGPIFERAGR